MKRTLLDVNVLLALAWPNHQHHGAAHRWFGRHLKNGWATCALTELGFVRLSSNPAYAENAVTPVEASELLRRLTREPGHKFWPSPPASDSGIYVSAAGHGQVNDAWLIHAAIRNKGRLATFDRRLLAHAHAETVAELIQT